jgi:hypothetical protein
LPTDTAGVLATQALPAAESLTIQRVNLRLTTILHGLNGCGQTIFPKMEIYCKKAVALLKKTTENDNWQIPVTYWDWHAGRKVNFFGYRCL